MKIFLHRAILSFYPLSFAIPDRIQ
jgi:hypothetical protein